MSSIKRNLENVILEKSTKSGSSIGVQRETWQKVKDIQVSIYEIDSRTNTTVAKYNESTHTGLTHEKEIKQGSYRLKKDNQIYKILSSNTKGRLTQLILKEISNV